MGTLWNTYAFYVLYANIDNFDAKDHNLDTDSLSVMDRWVLSRLQSTIKETDEDLASYKIPEAAKALQAFVDDLSNWYVRRSRKRYWAKGMEQDKINAYMTLYTCLVDISKAAAPMIPFMTEEIYQNLVRTEGSKAPESIHLCDYPVPDESLIDKALEKDMEEVLDIVVLGRAARNESGIKNRQPIGRMYVKADEMSDFYKQIILEELNVKSVEFSQDVRAFTTYTFKPQLKTVGPKYGKLLNKIREALTDLDGNDAMDTLKEQGALKFNFDGSEVSLSEEDLLIEMSNKEGFVEQSDNSVTVVLDTNLTPELLEEGYVRELISKIQTMRKEAGFEVMDKIRISMTGSEKLEEFLTENADFVKTETMASLIDMAGLSGYTKEWDINGERVTLGVEKIE